ncbi:MAG: G5 domain-containing protein, partial [Oscillospiraceae bacterium]
VATEIIKYSTSTKKTVNLYAGQTGVEQNGVNGEKIVTYQDKIVNGVKSSSKAVSTQITKSPVNCVRLIGIKVKVLSTTSPISSLALPSRYSLDKDGIPTSIIDTITGKAKSYTCNSPSYKGKGGTASGVKAQSGYIAVNPKQIPYGTEMYIVSSDGKYVYGYCIAADTGGFATAGTATVDLYMDTLSECRQWGSRNVNVYILNWGNGTVR